MRKKFTVLFVCTGNSCRSPMAEGIFRKELPEAYRKKIDVFSAGTGAFDGSPPARFAIEVCAENNIDISAHRSQALREHHLRRADIVFVMEKEHLKFIHEIFPRFQENVFLLKHFDRDKKKRVHSDIADPIGRSKDFYRKIFAELQGEIRRIMPRLLQLADAELARKNGGEE